MRPSLTPWPQNNRPVTTTARPRNVSAFWGIVFGKAWNVGKTHQTPSPHLPRTHRRSNKRVCKHNISIIPQLANVKLILDLIRQEVVPSDGLKTQEVDISMPGIPPLCFLHGKQSDNLIVH